MFNDPENLPKTSKNLGWGGKFALFYMNILEMYKIFPLFRTKRGNNSFAIDIDKHFMLTNTTTKQKLDWKGFFFSVYSW